MLLNFTADALHQLQLIRHIKTIKNGFILGSAMGTHMIVKHLFPANFTSDTIDEIYLTVYSRQGKWLLGVFFNNFKPFFNDWFIEDLILKMDDHNEPELYFYEGNKKCRFIDNSILPV